MPVVDLVLAAVIVCLSGGVVALVLRNRNLVDRLETGAERARQDLANAEDRVDDSVTALSRLEMALDAIPQGVLILDSSGKAVYSNSVATAFDSARHGDAIVAAAVEDVVADSALGVGDARVVELFGPPKRTLVVTSTPLDLGGELVGAVAVIDDVSERRRVDDMRRDFVSNISHELKTPVGAISLLADTLIDADDPEVTQRLAERIMAESSRMARTIDDLLELSRIESAEGSLFETVAIEDVIAEAVSRIRPAAEQAGIPLDVGAADPLLAVEGDRRQIVSALTNLLDNAVKYSERESPIELSAALVEGNAEISVRDHGIGIPALDIERVFERFYRVDQARSRRTGGTGLGLAIVRHVANNHDGEVAVESRVGEGSMFTLKLPAAPSVYTAIGSTNPSAA